MVKKIFLFIFSILSYSVFSQNQNIRNNFNFNDFYKVDSNIIVKRIDINDTLANYIYNNKDSSIFTTVLVLNKLYDLNLVKDTNDHFSIILFGNEFKINNILNLSYKKEKSLQNLNLQINFGYIVSSKTNNEKFIVLDGYQEFNGSYFIRYIFVFKYENEVTNSFFYTSIDLANNSETECLGYFLNIFNGTKIGFKDLTLDKKLNYRPLVHYVDLNNVKTIVY